MWVASLLLLVVVVVVVVVVAVCPLEYPRDLGVERMKRMVGRCDGASSRQSGEAVAKKKHH
jgi:hypothetical protein